MSDNELKNPRKIRDAEKSTWVYEEERTIRFSIELPISIHRTLKTRAAQTGTTMSDIVRELIVGELK